MRAAVRILVAGAGALVLSGCTGGDDDLASVQPSPSVVGELDIVTQAPSPTAQPSTSAEASPSASPQPGADAGAVDTDATDLQAVDTDEQLQALMDPWCEQAGQWWASSVSQSMDSWIEQGRDVYASSYVLDQYTPQMFDALRQSSWEDFDVTAVGFARQSAGACLFARDVEGDTQVLTLTYMILSADEDPFAARLLFDDDTTLQWATQAARDSIVREY